MAKKPKGEKLKNDSLITGDITFGDGKDHILNFGQIDGSIYFEGGDDKLDNHGVINGDVFGGEGRDHVHNLGEINGVVHMDGGTRDFVHNNPGATITGSSGIILTGVDGRVLNQGVIESTGFALGSVNGDAGVSIRGGSGNTITNHGSIFSNGEGIEVSLVFDPGSGLFVESAFNTHVVNTGEIIAQLNDGVRLAGGGTIVNSGYIEAVGEVGFASDGVSAFTSTQNFIDGDHVAELRNSGVILGERSGAAFSGGAVVDNSGLIEGASTGLFIQNATPSDPGVAIAVINNSGTIRGDDAPTPPNFTFIDGIGVSLGGGPGFARLEVTNSGLIEGATHGVHSVDALVGVFIENKSQGVIRGDFDNDGFGDAIQTRGSLNGPDLGGATNDTVLNKGLIEGNIVLGYEADLLDNSGTVDGDVDMGDGDDAVINDGTVTGTVELGAGNDSFEGGSSDETVSGGDGDDVISAGKGDDVLAGGSGDDIFAFVKHGGSNSIQDFEDGPDLIDLTALNTAFGDLDIQETGGHSVITFGDLEIVVESVTGLGAEDFIF